MAAVASALGRDLKIEDFNDRLVIQKGCYILNSWGFGPMYRFNMYVRGPYSTTLADEYYKIGDVTFRDTTVPDEAVDALRSIFSKGLGYSEAYTMVLMLKNKNPNASYNRIKERALELKPHLSSEIEEASLSLLI